MNLPDTISKFANGLIVGKFCPLHLGHEMLIQTALARCEQLVLLSYCKPEFSGFERARRDRWLESRFPSVRRLVIDDASLHQLTLAKGLQDYPKIPHNDADEYDHRLFVGWLCRHILDVTVDAVFTSEDYGDGFAAVLTDYFREFNLSATPVQHICVDKARQKIPISGTRLRDAIHSHRDYLAPAIYQDFVKRVCFLGGESSGKTTLAQMAAQSFHTEWVTEYGRERWVAQNGELHYPDMLEIAEAQVTRENQLARQANEWLFCDTSPLTTLFYSRAMFSQADERLVELAERRYDITFLCAPDFPFEQDGTRQNESFRGRQHNWYLQELTRRRVRFHLLTGDLSARLVEVQRILQTDKQSSVFHQ